MPEQYRGVLTELGGPEIGSTGNEKPRKVIVKEDVAKQYGKTFRCWSNSNEWQDLERLNGKPVLIDYEIEERQGGPQGSYKQNVIVGVYPGEGNGVQPAPAPAPAPSGGDWSVPSQPAASGEPATYSKDDYWERREAADARRSLEMESAWAVREAQSFLQHHGDVTPENLRQKAIDFISLKRTLADELETDPSWQK